MANDVQPVQKTITQSKMIPIAKLTDKNEIEHLFLQKDVQALYSQENPNKKLVFVEVIDNQKNGKEVGLLYRIHDKERNVTETSIISVVTLDEGIYYYVPPGGGIGKTTCSTSDCPSDEDGCQPHLIRDKCSPCTNAGKCTRTTSVAYGDAVGNALYGCW